MFLVQKLMPRLDLVERGSNLDPLLQNLHRISLELVILAVRKLQSQANQSDVVRNLMMLPEMLDELVYGSIRQRCHDHPMPHQCCQNIL